ncbi:sensor histidine kinase [Kitasatospora sp. MBT63]|uniref:sensor histidine kinase n=1 Tax=Kitasatospora sp. MBT63 TaxID=1444768 RepID=UPI00053AF225|nr:histidine kinase [Kitasatospora sp. MBT63]
MARDELAGDEAARPEPAPLFALGILYTALLAYLVQVSVNLSVLPLATTSIVLGIVCFVAICCCQLVHALPQAKQVRRRYGRVTLTVQALLTYLPILVFGAIWGAAGGFLAASGLMLLEGLWAWVWYAGVVLSMAGVAVAFQLRPVEVVYVAVSTLLSGLMMYGLSRLVTLVVELHRARGQLARLAVAQERLRFARDLHDLLGYSLSAITLKSEVAIRLVHNNPGRAVDELTSVLGISRQALSDVRAVARGYRDMSLAGEAESARGMLEAADIVVETRIECADLPGVVDTTLATVLREAVTNMLRHSKVERCRIEVNEAGPDIRLRIVNDGVPERQRQRARVVGQLPMPRAAGEEGGSGLGNLETRLAAIGGTLTAGVQPDGTFQVVALVPLAQQTDLRSVS